MKKLKKILQQTQPSNVTDKQFGKESQCQSQAKEIKELYIYI